MRTLLFFHEQIISGSLSPLSSSPLTFWTHNARGQSGSRARINAQLWATQISMTVEIIASSGGRDERGKRRIRRLHYRCIARREASRINSDAFDHTKMTFAAVLSEGLSLISRQHRKIPTSLYILYQSITLTFMEMVVDARESLL